MNFTQSKEYKFYKTASDVSTHAQLVIIMIGLVANVLTIYLLKSKPATNAGKKNKYAGVRLSYRNRPGVQIHNSFSSSELYMLALAISDTLFLVSHLLEDIAPDLTSNDFFHWINQSNVMCKVVLYVRNLARVCSSYLVVFFAYERFIVIKSPLNRLKFHNKRLTKFKINKKIIILIIFIASMLLNIYTLIINGLRKPDQHEFREIASTPAIPFNNNSLECDVLNEYKNIYDYLVVFYVSIGVIIPLILICYFNFYITRVLMTRKNRMLRHFFAQLDQQQQLQVQMQLQYLQQQQQQQLPHNNSIGSIELHDGQILQMIALHNQKKQQQQRLPGMAEQERMLRENSFEFGHPNKDEKHCNCCCFGKSDSKNASNGRKSRRMSADDMRAAVGGGVGQTTKEQTLSSHHPNDNNKVGGASRSKSVDVTSVRFSVLTAANGGTGGGLMPGGTANGVNGSLAKSSIASSQYSAGMSQKLKESGRATLILILISACFVGLNVPYVLTWANFFVPYKQDRLNTPEKIYGRFAWVTIGEIFHIANFSINLFLYCLASKLFRHELWARLSVIKNCRIQIRFKRNPTI